MTYAKLLNEAVDTCVIFDDGVVYLAPGYRKILQIFQLEAYNVDDFPGVKNSDIYDALEKYIDMQRQKMTRRRMKAMDKIADILDVLEYEQSDEMRDLESKFIEKMNEESLAGEKKEEEEVKEDIKKNILPIFAKKEVTETPKA